MFSAVAAVLVKVLVELSVVYVRNLINTEYVVWLISVDSCVVLLGFVLVENVHVSLDSFVEDSVWMLVHHVGWMSVKHVG